MYGDKINKIKPNINPVEIEINIPLVVKESIRYKSSLFSAMNLVKPDPMPNPDRTNPNEYAVKARVYNPKSADP